MMPSVFAAMAATSLAGPLAYQGPGPGQTQSPLRDHGSTCSMFPVEHSHAQSALRQNARCPSRGHSHRLIQITDTAALPRKLVCSNDDTDHVPIRPQIDGGRARELYSLGQVSAYLSPQQLEPQPQKTSYPVLFQHRLRLLMPPDILTPKQLLFA